MTQLLLDTDIGTDVDDALALALLIAKPDVDLVGVTTVHGHAPLRAAIARSLRDAGIAVEYEGQILRTIDHPERRPNMRVCSAADGPAFVADWMDAVVRV